MFSTLRSAAGRTGRQVTGLKSLRFTSSSCQIQDNVVKSRYSLGDSYKGATIIDTIRADTCNWGDRTAYECPSMGIKYTHNEIFKLGRNFGTALLQAGLKRGDICAIVLPNCPQYSPIMNGMLETGIVASPISPLSTPDELSKMLVNCRAKGVVTFPPFVPLMQSIHEQVGGDILKVVISTGEAEDGCHSYDDMIKVDSGSTEFIKSSQVDTADLDAMILWSSGTTGPPKGVLLTHENIVTQVQQILHKNVSDFEPGKESGLGLLPFFHVFGQIALMYTAVTGGGRVVTMPAFSPELFISILKTQKLEYLHVVPPLVAFVATTPLITSEDLASLKTIVCGGASCPPVHVQKLLEKCPRKPFFHDTFGMTELSGASHMLFYDDGYKHLGSVGQPMPGALAKVIDLETGAAVGTKVDGEICVKSPQVMKGYLNNPEATAATKSADGWVRTGDIGHYDEEGYFYVVDRLKELIKVKGLQVAPAELEHLISSHPKVADVAVIGIPDDRAGELPRGYIVPKDASLTPAEINDFLKSKVAEHKQLAGGIEIVEAIPKSPSGKILRRELKTKYMSSKSQ